MRVFHLGIGVPDFRPFPRLAEKPPGNIPEGIALDHGITVWVTVLELHFGLGHTGLGQAASGKQ
ncbi:hypothetical protein D3C80_1856070 [compost metagenome]